VDPAHLKAFALRPRQALAESKARYLEERFERLGIGEAFRMADELRLSLLILAGPETPERRSADLENHIEQSRLWRRIASAKRD
jgi:hypothetical protein